MKRPETRRPAAAFHEAASAQRERAQLREEAAGGSGADAAIWGEMPLSWILALAGGAMIGVASAFLFLTHGRVAGISGVVGAILPPSPVRDRAWRYAFLVGLLAAGVIGAVVAPSAVGASVRSWPLVVVAGLLVGFGTRLGNGCTSGHGVCGLARFSVRSLAAVVTFMTTGAITAWVAGGLS